MTITVSGGSGSFDARLDELVAVYFKMIAFNCLNNKIYHLS